MPEPAPRNPWLQPDADADADLPAGEVHVWRCPVDLPPGDLARCHDILDPAEQARAERFSTPADRRRFTVARAGLRLILARYLGCAPQEIALSVGTHGKPRLQTADATPALEFNVSHAGKLALIALAPVGRAVGVDVEWTGRDVEPLDLGRRVLAPAEIRMLEQTPAAERARLFLSLWTIKEAVVKALGKGISMPLSSFTVIYGPDAPPRLVAGPEAVGVSDLTVRPLTPDGNHLGAVAAAGSGWSLRRWSAARILAHAPGSR